MPEFNAAEFTLPEFHLKDTSPWGGGWTTETEPGLQGWRIRRHGRVYVMGQAHVKGCASIMLMSGDSIDVALYDDLTPNEAAAALGRGERLHGDSYFQHSYAKSGWGLYIIDKILYWRKWVEEHG